MVALVQAKILAISKYKLMRQKARPVVVSTILYMGRSKLLRKVGVLTLAPFPAFIQRIRGLAIVSAPQQQSNSILIESNTMVPDPVTEVLVPPPVLLGPSASLIRRRIDGAWRPISAERH